MTFAISEFVQGLLPGLKKDTVLEDLRVSIDNIDKIVVPAMDKVTAVLKDKFKSQALTDLNKAFNGAYKGKIKGNNFLVIARDSLTNIRANADYVDSQLQELLESTIVPDGLTSRKAVMIRSSKQIAFIADMTLDLANVALILETLEANGELSEDMELSKGTTIRVQRNIVRYAYALMDFSKDPKEFQKLFEGTRDLYVGGSNAKNVSAAATELELDPFDSRLVQNVAYNPIYHLRIAVAQWQAKRYHAAKDKKKLLELRVLQLKAEQEKKSDPRILNEINYTQSRIDKIDRDLHETETDLGM